MAEEPLSFLHFNTQLTTYPASASSRTIEKLSHALKSVMVNQLQESRITSQIPTIMTESNVINPRSSGSTVLYHTPVSREARAREAAIHHARLLQERKDVEMEILENMESLIEYPASSDADPAQPLSEDVTHIKKMLIPFQPSDYDALIEERNINRKCGYILCPKPNKLRGTKAKFGFLHTKDKGMKIVDQKTLEQWCSPQCGKRALYLRVQLDEEPAWERVGGIGGNIVLLDERPRSSLPSKRGSKIAEGLDKVDGQNGDDTVAATMKDLAIERGDGNARANSSRLAKLEIIENTEFQREHQHPPHLNGQPSNVHELIEGYRPQRPGPEPKGSAEAGDSDEDDILSDLARM